MNKQFKTISLSLLAVVLLTQVVPAQGLNAFTKFLGLGSFVGAASYGYIRSQKTDQNTQGEEFTKCDKDELVKNVGKDYQTAKNFVAGKLASVDTFVKAKLSSVVAFAQANVVPAFAGFGIAAIYNTGLLGKTARAILSKNQRSIISWVLPTVVGGYTYKNKDKIYAYGKSFFSIQENNNKSL